MDVLDFIDKHLNELFVLVVALIVLIATRNCG